MILVAVGITMLFGIAAMAIDFSRMYTFIAQLRFLTDATALSVTSDLKRGGVTQSTATDRALALRTSNRVNGTVLSDSGMGSADIEPGVWNIASQSFTGTTWSAATAVRTTARYDAPWSLSRVFGTTAARRLTQVTVASLGSVNTSSCLKPWGVPYSNILVTLGRSATDTAYRLTAADVATLRDNQTSIAFKVSSSTSNAGGAVIGSNTINGNYYAVRYPPVQYANGTAGNPASGANNYRDGVADLSCSSASGTASVGDWLDLESGNMVGPTKQGMSTLCGQSGANFSCSQDIVVPIWNARSSASASAWVQVLYLGAFRLTAYQNGSVIGYLKTLSASPGSGGGTPTPGLILTGMLVK
jgi:hypothetical protein